MVEAIFGAACFMSVATVVVWFGGLIVFAPLHERTLLFQIENRFRIADIASLAILLQVAIAVVIAITPQRAVEARITMVVILLAAVAGCWISGLRMLSRAGVSNGLRRWLFLTFMVPLGYLSVMVIASSIFTLPISLEAISHGIRGDRFALVVGIFMLLLIPCAIIIAIACNQIGRKMALRARDDQAIRDGINFEQLHQDQKEDWVPHYLAAHNRQEHEGIWLEEPVITASFDEPPSSPSNEESGSASISANPDSSHKE